MEARSWAQAVLLPYGLPMRAQPDVSQWRVEFSAPLPAADAEEYAENASIALRVGTANQPVIVSADSARLGDGLRVMIIIESDDLAGAVMAALPVARQALGALPITAMTAVEA